MSSIVVLMATEIVTVAILLRLARTTLSDWIIRSGAFAISLGSACSFGLGIQSALFPLILYGTEIELLAPLAWMALAVAGFALVGTMHVPPVPIAIPAGFVVAVFLFTLLDLFATVGVVMLIAGLAVCAWRRQIVLPLARLPAEADG